MTKDELKELIAGKIATQGNQVDVSGALATILNELVEGAGGGSSTIIDLTSMGELDDGEWAIPDGLIPDNYNPQGGDAIKAMVGLNYGEAKPYLFTLVGSASTGEGKDGFISALYGDFTTMGSGYLTLSYEVEDREGWKIRVRKNQEPL